MSNAKIDVEVVTLVLERHNFHGSVIYLVDNYRNVDPGSGGLTMTIQTRQDGVKSTYLSKLVVRGCNGNEFAIGVAQ